MSSSAKERRVPSNSETGCIDSARMALLKKLAAVNIFNQQHHSNHDVSAMTSQKSEEQPPSHDESQRSNSLFDLLNKELSQVSNNTYNMPRQIKSLFSANDSNFPIYKQFGATVETDIHGIRQDAPKKTLKQSIYQKLLRGKSKSINKGEQRNHKKVNQDLIKQATFRPQKGTLKSLSKQVFKVDSFKLKSNLSSKIKSTLQTQQTPKHLTKYQELLKYSHLIGDNERDRCKQNIDQSNSQSFIIPVTAGRQRPQSQVVKLNLKKSLQMKKRFFQNYYSELDKPQKVGILDMNFQERQNQCIRSRSLKIIKNDINKLKNEMAECTFKPRLTPYRRPDNKQPLQSERKYGEMRRSVTKPLVHYR